jgi:dTMP kinase
MPEKLIVFEGIEGSGKTTCINAVAEELAKKNLKFIKTEEPNAEYGIGSMIKPELLQKLTINDALVDLFAFSLDRRLHLLKQIEPALADGKIVLCDRYYHSQIAYQGYLKGIKNYVMDVQGIFLKPYLTLLFDLPAKLAMQRIQSARQTKEKFDQQETLEKLRRAYLDMTERLDERFKILDATLPKEKLAQQAIKTICEVLNI